MLDNSTSTWYYYHYDGLGSVVALSKLNGSQVQIVESYIYDAFGRTLIQDSAGPDGKWMTPDDPTPLASSQFGNPFMFTGRAFDPETGLYDFRARMYSPTLGRFLQPDPIGYADSMNLYQYVLNNPINYLDPYGLSRWGDMWSYITEGHGITREDFADVGNAVVGGAAITANAYTFGQIDSLNAYASEKVCEYGDAGKASQFLANVSRDIATELAIDAATAGAGGVLKLLSKADDAVDCFRALDKTDNVVGYTRNIGCFTAGTVIVTPFGDIPIEQIQPEDPVWAHDFETGEVIVCEVARTFVRQVDGLVVVEVGGQVIEATTEHPFWVVNSGWIAAKDLQVGHMLQTLDGDYLPVEDVCLRPGLVTVYNFEVADAHDYFVSGAEVLVHNAPCLEQQALRDLVNDVTNKGRKALNLADTKQVIKWAKETNYPGFRASMKDIARSNNHWVGGSHIHLPGAGKGGHVPISR